LIVFSLIFDNNDDDYAAQDAQVPGLSRALVRARAPFG
jgi:hypothetical protein